MRAAVTSLRTHNGGVAARRAFRVAANAAMAASATALSLPAGSPAGSVAVIALGFEPVTRAGAGLVGHWRTFGDSSNDGSNATLIKGGDWSSA